MRKITSISFLKGFGIELCEGVEAALSHDKTGILLRNPLLLKMDGTPLGEGDTTKAGNLPLGRTYRLGYGYSTRAEGTALILPAEGLLEQLVGVTPPMLYGHGGILRLHFTVCSSISKEYIQKSTTAILLFPN